MAPKPYLSIAGLLLVPLFAHCMPAPSGRSGDIERRQLDAVATTRTTVYAAETSTQYTTVTSTLQALPLAASALPASVTTDPAAIESSVPLLVDYPGGALHLFSPPPSTSTSPPATIGAPGPSVPAPPPSVSVSAPNLSTSPDATVSPPGASSAPLVMAYYPDWVSDDYPPEKIDFDRFDWVDFAFAVPDENFELSWDGSDDAPDVLRRLVQCAHAKGKHVKLSVGGWTGSKYFSSAAATPQGRLTLVSNILAPYQQFNLDGIDIDWEYPAQGGNTGNVVSPDDSANFLEFLRLLRATLPPGAVITAATQTVPFAGPDGAPMRDVSDFAGVLDWVLIMNYDTWGSSSDPGPNAPLSDACGNSTQANANGLSALQAWTAAGFPAHQLVLGVPSYGYLSRSTVSYLQTRALPMRRRHFSGASRGRRRQRQRQRQRRRQEQGQEHAARRRSPVPGFEWFSSLADVISPGVVRVKNEDGGMDDGQVQFGELVAQGVLLGYSSSPSPSAAASADPSSLHVDSTDVGYPSANGTGFDDAPAADGSSTGSGSGTTPAYTGSFSGAGAGALRLAIENAEPRSLFAGDQGFVRMWDACSSTPFLRSEGAGQVVTYDDPVSLEMKAQMVRQAGMRGVNMFDVHGDTDAWDLTDALRRGLGLV